MTKDQTPEEELKSRYIELLDRTDLLGSDKEGVKEFFKAAQVAVKKAREEGLERHCT